MDKSIRITFRQIMFILIVIFGFIFFEITNKNTSHSLNVFSSRTHSKGDILADRMSKIVILTKVGATAQKELANEIKKSGSYNFSYNILKIDEAIRELNELKVFDELLHYKGLTLSYLKEINKLLELGEEKFKDYNSVTVSKFNNQAKIVEKLYELDREELLKILHKNNIEYYVKSDGGIRFTWKELK
ncbi:MULTISPECIES: hypothetical protein [Psychrilyobacter]|uniref:Uncharacterized protein n=1 Tax=Psychrilyobacter piezotolerans TaxID=2293438 RepID=A0ABX9KG53_9FUSO|nr:MULTISPECIES: hypothetical protein [Psychrilyobacter]MCS5420464.1 hypothetical protein [Psychrilyobacter sp. S5]NDI78242.1 hypothetical protein [Psychrilyobacter piezotolerans]RDE61199.1 hypothetical protein DV867_09380 [Psychrilyobacter sp. S5]REI40867.1 hypothetical protein DYH56_09380 [Psychrilyobacter piezotolerans]